MEAIISTFHIDWKIIIAQAINFGIVFLVLYIFALKPLSKVMTDRSQKISKGIDDAKTNAMLLEKSKAEYEEALNKARAEANKIFQESKKQAMDEKSVMLEETRVSVTELVEKGKKTLEAEKMKMVEEAKAEIVKLAMLATEKLISTKQNINDL